MSHLEISSDSLDRARHQGKTTYNADDNSGSTRPNRVNSNGIELNTTHSMELPDSRLKVNYNDKLATGGAHGQPAPSGCSGATGSVNGDAQRPVGANTESSSPAANPGEALENGSGSTYTGKPVASFRRQRASRACETCHARKVRCDAASLGVPCTNCVAFSIECKIPAPKRKKNQKKDPNSPPSNENNEMNPPMPMKRTSIRPDLENIRQAEEQRERQHQASVVVPEPRPAVSAPSQPPAPPPTAQENPSTQYPSFMKPKFARAPIREAGRVAYLGESSNLSLLVHDKHGSSDVVHYPLPDDIRGPRARLVDLDNLEIDILHQRGAFLLPPRSLCDELVDAYFTWVAPVVPIINRSRFMRRYQDPKNPPSLLLLQAMLLAGCRVCTNPQLMDATGSTTPAAMTFYKRAKALYDANYEDDRVTIVQALVLMGWYWEGPEDVTKNVFYWTRVATVVAQGSGMHRSVESSQLSRTDKRLWKRIWWTLYTRDRSVAVALGRPISINTDDSDVEMITEDDFIEDETDTPSGTPVSADYPPDRIHVQFFLQYVKLCEIMGLVLSQQYSVASKASRGTAIDLTHSDIALADWLQNCPREMCWEKDRHHFWSALLHSNYYTTLCLLHRAHMPPATMANMHSDGHGPSSSTQPGFVGPGGTRVYPSKSIAFQAAAMITSIINQLQIHDQLRFTPAFIVYSLFSALIMHVYQMRSSDPQTVSACHEKISICMQALRDVSHAWLVAKMVHTLFESILGNKAMEEKMQKAAGRRHHHFRQMLKHGLGHHQQRPQMPQRHPHNTPGISHVPPATLQKGLSTGGHETVNPAATNTASSTAGVPGTPPIEIPVQVANVASTLPNGSATHDATAASTGPTEIMHGQAQHDTLPRKRKFSDFEQVGMPGSGTPAPQMSYERSRPPTPVNGAVGVNSDSGHSKPQNAGSHSERTRKATQNHHDHTRHDAFFGAPAPGEHGVTTRPTTPFNPYSFSIPNTPPHLFLVTRNSPNLDQAMWENFQPDQLFPDGAMRGLGLEEFGLSPADPVSTVNPTGIDNDSSGRAGTIHHHDMTVDPGLQTSTISQAPGDVSDAQGPLHQPPTSLMTQQTLPATDAGINAQVNTLFSAHGNHHEGFVQQPFQPSPLDEAGGLQQPPNPGEAPLSDDNWSNSSRGASGGPIVPLTLNVEDWFQFFGIQGSFDTT